MKTSSIFKSRWMALLWAAGILWFAYDTANSQPQAPSNSTNTEQASDDSGASATPENTDQVAKALDGKF